MYSATGSFLPISVPLRSGCADWFRLLRVAGRRSASIFLDHVAGVRHAQIGESGVHPVALDHHLVGVEVTELHKRTEHVLQRLLGRLRHRVDDELGVLGTSYGSS